MASPRSPPDPTLVPEPSSTPPPLVHQTLVVSGTCHSSTDFGGIYHLQAMAANGAPYYRHAAGRWLYYDEDCSGNAGYLRLGSWTIRFPMAAGPVT
eukprot:5640025-Prymnesium_polylepis.1